MNILNMTASELVDYVYITLEDRTELENQLAQKLDSALEEVAMLRSEAEPGFGEPD